MKQELSPVITIQLFPELLTGLLDLLTSLSKEEWAKGIPRKSWSVKDVVLHLLGGDVGVLSRERDGYVAATPNVGGYRELVAFLKTQNDSWIDGTQRISPRLLCDLLRFTGMQVEAYFQSLDPHTLGGPVSWAGAEPTPNWFDIAREYTERWHHQQHIREGVEKPGYAEPRYLKPALDTFMRAMPYTYRDVDAEDGTTVEVTISGDTEGRWLLLRERGKWNLYLGQSKDADAAVVIPQEIAWRLFTKWFPRKEAIRLSEVRGDTALAGRVFDMTSVIA